MVLETGERPTDARLELAIEQHVTDHARLPGDRVEREHADARQVVAVEVAVRAAEQLVAAADREHRRAPVDRLPQLGGLGAKSCATSACSRSWPPPT